MDNIKEIDSDIEYTVTDLDESNKANNNLENIKALLDSPLGHTAMKKGLKILLKELSKNFMGKILISKGASYFVNNLASITHKKDLQRLKKRKYKGYKKKYINEVLPRRQEIIESELKSRMIKSLSKFL